MNKGISCITVAKRSRGERDDVPQNKRIMVQREEAVRLKIYFESRADGLLMTGCE